MVLPRIIFSPTPKADTTLTETISSFFEQKGVALYYNSDYFGDNQAKQELHKVKKMCLHHRGLLLVNEVEHAALVRADGIMIDISDPSEINGLDGLRSDILKGVYAQNVQDLGKLYEWGLADFICVGPIGELGKGISLLAMKSMLADARLLGYNIPIFAFGDIAVDVALDLLKNGCYGIQLSDMDKLSGIQQLIDKNPIRGYK